MGCMSVGRSSFLYLALLGVATGAMGWPLAESAFGGKSKLSKEEKKREKEREKAAKKEREEAEKREKEREKEAKEEREEAEKRSKEEEKDREKAAKERLKLLKDGEIGSLDSVPVPLPPNLDEFVTNRTVAIQLGKALFWDMQVGSDGKTACATCHFHAGGDSRTKNTLSPNGGSFRGANYQLSAADFPFHKLADPDKKRSRKNPVICDTSEVAGSQGVVKKEFVSIVDGSAVDEGILLPDPVFHIHGANARQVTGRNAPTVINAVFNDRQFWDGRANRFFNGVNPFGDMDPDARVWVTSGNGGSLTQKRILLDNASLASQAVGPPNNSIEMAWHVRTFPELGRKMLQLLPLAKQEVDPTDSVLGCYAKARQKGCVDGLSYAYLISQAFAREYWSGTELTPDGYTQMEANFALFWGLSIMMYESTLVSDDAPFDRYVKGDDSALSELAIEGLEIFLDQGKCVNCHSGPEFTGAAISQLRGVLADPEEPMIELMKMEIGPEAFYDGGFYNIGVRPTEEDLGVGGRHPVLGPWSLARRVQEGQHPDLNGLSLSIGPHDRLAVDGAFKTPTLRNVELTGPFMHNGGMRTLTEVVQFYARQADFFEENIENLDPDVDGIGHVRGDEERVAALVEFMKTLTDDRVRYERAPFDHPELIIPNGHRGVDGEIALDDDIILPAVGRNGGRRLQSFEEILP